MSRSLGAGESSMTALDTKDSLRSGPHDYVLFHTIWRSPTIISFRYAPRIARKRSRLASII